MSEQTTSHHITINSPGLESGQMIGARYKIVDLLGRGGMGIVYRAQDLELGIDVALKLLKPEFLGDENALRRLKDELLLARQVSHRNVVRIHDLGADPALGVTYISMAFIEGRTLRAILQTEGPLPLERAIPLILELCAGLQAAHDVGVVHRDLKPENVIVDTQGQSFITDFGIARSVDSGTVTRTGALVGTLQYMSPEQARGEKVDARSDVYAFGLVAYEMLTGRLPHESGTTPEFVGRLMGQKPVDLRRYKPEIPVYLARTLMRCLASDPSLRYTCILDVARSIETKRAEGKPLFSIARLRAVRHDRRALMFFLALALIIVSLLGYRLIPTGSRKDNAPPAAFVPPAAVVLPVAVGQGSVAVLPFSNRSADPRLDWLRTGLAELVASDLVETRELRVAAPSETFQLLRDLKLREAEVQNETTLLQVSRFLNCDLILAGDFGQVGNELAVEIKLYKITAGSLIQAASLRRAGSAENVFHLATGLAVEVRNAIHFGGDRLPQAPMTRSTDALRSYSNALEYLRQGEYSKAIELLGQAVSSDPKFALAYARLSEAYYGWGRPEDSKRAYEKALSALEGSERNRLLESFQMRAQHALLGNDLAAAIDLYKQAAAAYPRNIENYLALGDAYERKGELEAAVASYERAAEIEPNNFRVSLALGRIYILADKYDNAIERLTRALSASTQVNNDQGRADALNAIGIVHQRTQRFAEAERSFLESIAIKKKIGDKRGIAVTLQNLANLNSQRGKPRAAEAKALEARAIFEQLGNRQGMADIAFNLGHIYQDTGRFPAALESFRRALILARELGNPAFLAQLDERIGQIYFFLGQYPDADTYQRQALAERERMGDEEGIIRSLQSLGDVDLEQARCETALERYRAALDRGRRLGHAEAAMVSISQMGLVYQMTGRYRAALQSYEEARDGFARLKQQGRSAEIFKRLASLHLEIRDLDRARHYLRQAIEAAAPVRDKALLGEIAMIEGEMAFVQGEVGNARQAFARALQSAKESGSAKTVLLAEIHTAGLESRLGGGQGAVALLERHLARAEQMGQADAVARCYAYLLASRGTDRGAKQTKNWIGRVFSPAKAPNDSAVETEQARRWIGRLRDYGFKGQLMRSCFLAAASESRAGHKSEAKTYAAEGARLLEELLLELDPNQRENFRGAARAAAPPPG